MSLSNNMHIINGNNNIPDIYKNSVIAIGNFDGIHLGHKHLINKVLEVANAEGKKSGIITFDPHPKAYFGGLKNFHQVTTDAVKIEILEKLKIDILFELNFDKSLSKMSPEEFFLEVIYKNLEASHVIVGEDFRFGYERSGDVHKLEELCNSKDIGFNSIQKQKDINSVIYSSSRVRTNITSGNITDLTKLLGHYWFVNGHVKHGKKKGTELGFPTINIEFEDTLKLAHGIYATNVYLEGKKYHGASYYGARPTFNDQGDILETYIFDFDRDIYNQEVKIEFIDFIREDQKFKNEEELIKQMEIDCCNVKDKLQYYDKYTSLIDNS
jgi:riboflavin kinase/FMN adenylyltransferase